MAELRNKIEEFKIEIRSVLLPVKDGVPLKNVNEMYKGIIGQDIPYRELGFGTVHELFCALPDTIKLDCRGSNNTYVFAVCNKETAHIAKLVSKQKVNSNVSKKSHSTHGYSSKVFRPSYNPKHHPPQLQIDPKVKQNIQDLLIRYPQGLKMEQLKFAYRSNYRVDLNYQDYSYAKIDDFVRALHSDNTLILLESSNSSVIYSIKCNDPSSRWTTQNVHRNQVNQSYVKELLCSRYPLKSKKCHIISNTVPCCPQFIPESVQQNIYNLLKSYSDGILLTEFEEKYVLNFKESFLWMDLNYHNLESALKALKFKPPILFISCELNHLKVMLEPKKCISSQTNDLPVPIPAQGKPFVPQDAVTLGHVYSPVKVPFEYDKYFSVFVSTVESPGKIWLQLISQEYQENSLLTELMNNLEHFYQSLEAENYQVPDEYFHKSLICAVPFPESQVWHRGCITDIYKLKTVEVFCYDFGTVCKVPKDNIRFLKKSFSMLPAQAFCARLARIQPVATAFSQECCSRLHDLCYKKPLMAQITSTKFLNMISLILCDTSGEEDIFLNDALVTEGLVKISADKIKLRKPKSSSISCSVPNILTGNLNLPGCFLPPETLENRSNNIPGSKTTENISPQISSNDICHKASHLRLLTNNRKTFYKTPSVSTIIPTVENQDSVIDPVILKRLEERTLANLKSHTGKANNSRTINSLPEIMIPVRPDDQNLHSIQQNGSSKNHEEPEVYESSLEGDQEDDDKSTVSTFTNFVLTCIAKQKRFCKRVCFRDTDNIAHLINFCGQPYLTSADVSALIFVADIIKRVLNLYQYPPCHTVISRDEHPALFEELEHLLATGFAENDSKTEKIILYVLPDVLKILAFLNQNKQSLVEDIEEMYHNFDPADIYWETTEDPSSLLCKNIINTNANTLKIKLLKTQEKRKSLLMSMLNDDFSTTEELEHLTSLNEQILKLKIQLLKSVDIHESRCEMEHTHKMPNIVDNLKTGSKTSEIQATPSEVANFFIQQGTGTSVQPSTTLTMTTSQGNGSLLISQNSSYLPGNFSSYPLSAYAYVPPDLNTFAMSGRWF